MKLTNKSKYLINLFDKNKMIKKEKLTNETQNILNDFYLTLVQAFKFVQKINPQVEKLFVTAFKDLYVSQAK